MKFVSFVLVIAFSCAFVRADGSKAADAVRTWLERCGIEEGYDSKQACFVTVGDYVKTLPNLDASDFLSVREQMSLVATLLAKSKLIQILDRRISSTSTTTIQRDGDMTTHTTMSIIDIFSRAPLHGCMVLHTEEAYEDGKYSVAVAVKWGEKQEKAALAALSGTGPETTEEIDEAEWAAWAARSDFSKLSGPVQFTDAKGVFRYAGIACVDVEGKKGKEFINAMRLAELRAEQALVYSLWADTIAHTHALSILSRKKAADVEEVEVVRDFVSYLQQACKRHILRRKVFSGKFVHPLTGRKMFVYVAGIDPSKLAKLKVLEEELQ